MEKPKRWQLFLIAAVIFLTVYNILPTVFFYTKPLGSPIDQKRAEKIETDIAVRVNSLEGESLSWLDSFCNLLKLKPLSIALDTSNPQFVQIKFKDHTDAQKFRRYLPHAGNLIGFVPAQLNVYDRDLTSKTVIVQRRIPVHLDTKTIQNYFQFGSKRNAEGGPTDFYRGIIDDRLVFLGTSAGGTSENASLIQTSLGHLQDPAAQDLLFMLSQNLLNFTKVFDENSSIAKRYFASFSQIEVANQRQFIEHWIGALERLKDQVRLERIALSQEKESLVGEEKYLETIKQQRLEWLNNRENLLINSAAIVKKHIADFSAGKTPLNFTTMKASLKEAGQTAGHQQTIHLTGHHPFIESLTIDWDSERIVLNLYSDVQQMKDRLTLGNQKDQLDQLIYNDIASLSRQAGEKIKPYLDRFEIQISDLPDSQTFVAMRLYNIAKAEADTMRSTLASNWLPQHPDLQRTVFPIWDYETYQSLPADQKKLGLVVFAPSMLNKMPPKGFKMNSIYVVAKGVNKILERFESQDSDAAKQFKRDFNDLSSMLQKNGFTGYSGAAYPIAAEFQSDVIFEHEDYYQTILKATREDFSVHGTKRYALLEFSNVEQRILTENKIDNSLHEDLLKWRDDYRAAQVNLRGTSKFDVPAPTSNVLWDNLKLSFVKYFRGDERKVIRWGLDLSGGKTVQIELRDNNNRVVTDEADIRQGINELYNRVNKMGVSEVSIRQEGNSIALDFPGSQSLSASDLVKASSMYFHIVNEKFMVNQTLAEATHRFLQDVWNEAVVTNRKDVEEINAIAWRHLYGESTNPDAVQPRSAYAKTLYENGLRLAHPQEMNSSSDFDETFSKISVYRGTEWQGQTHPLLIVFRNYALEGANLENVHVSYDPSKGNFLVFGVKGSYSAKDGLKISPRDDLQAWTSQFSKEKIAGTPLEAYSRGEGWRMAIILNGSVTTAPPLQSTLRDSASITGSFTQREINKLEADLKAGSLSFTPRILSEKNVSPELGGQERLHGIVATICALVLAILTMIGYYRFGGLIASAAVIFNLLIMWAALQNLGATLTLAGIAGVILTVAMAVDANVLVFERIREEFAATGRIAAAVHAGYRKALSAIIDSNITTLIAALILMHFDAGPIRGFAVTLIIGIVSSLFTALFVTRIFFTWWVQNPKHRELKMANFIKGAHFNFLKFTKPTVLVSAIVILIGSYLLITQRQTILGMDFTGGYALTVELPVSGKHEYRTQVEKALTTQGLTAQEFQIRELHPSNNVRIFLSSSLEQSGRPFAGMPVSTDAAEVTYPFESNPKILWIVNALQASHIQLAPPVLQDLDQNWTAISGQMSDTMRTHALIGICIALFCILIYITIRFEFKYAISATLCLIHDVIFCVGVVGILHLLGVPIQIDLHIVAALMTIVGYSLNDTIIVFDRIREDARLMRKNSLTEIINHALNVTLSRTLMTSGITLLVLIPLIVLGGSTIFGFALVMAIGVIFGTLSSLFIAAPLMQYFHNREMQKQQRLALHEQ